MATSQMQQHIIELCAIDADYAKQKVKISPIGEVTGLDGRQFDIDGNTVLQRLNDSGLELVLNIAHSYNGEAAGWFSEFELQTDGIYAKLSLNDSGEQLIAAKSYKYLSPEYFVDYNTNDVIRIVGVGLVNQPNLLNEALNRIDNSTQEDKTMTENHDANSEFQDELDHLKQQNDNLNQQVADLTAQLATTKVDNAIASGKLAPAKRDFALELEPNALDGFLVLEAQSFTKTDNNLNPDQNDDAIDSNPVMDQLGLTNEQGN